MLTLFFAIFIQILPCHSDFFFFHPTLSIYSILSGRPMVVVSTAAFHARVRGSAPGLGGLKETFLFLPHPLISSVLWGASMTERRTVSFHSSHHPQEVLLAQFSLYVHKGDLKPDSFHFIHHINSHKIWYSNKRD